jgi:putative nucleotidyltransferase with HDIG domain
VSQDELTSMRGQLMVFARELKESYRAERTRARELEHALRELQDSYLATVKTLAIMVEAKDFGTADHLDRTHRVATVLTEAIDPKLLERKELGYGFLLHDIGKVAVPEAVINKPGPLSGAEWEVMRTHPVVGAQIVSPMKFLGEAVDVIKYHHERFEGGGYPKGLKGEEIPLHTRIFLVVDAFDAMTSDRAYRRALPREEAIEELERCSGTQFDPMVVETFVNLVESEREFLAHVPSS